MDEKKATPKYITVKFQNTKVKGKILQPSELEIFHIQDQGSEEQPAFPQQYREKLWRKMISSLARLAECRGKKTRSGKLLEDIL